MLGWLRDLVSGRRAGVANVGPEPIVVHAHERPAPLEPLPAVVVPAGPAGPEGPPGALLPAVPPVLAPAVPPPQVPRLGKELRRLARRSATSGYGGPPETEPVVAAWLQQLHGELIVTFHSSRERASARELSRAAPAALERAQRTHDEVVKATGGRIAAAAGVPPMGAPTADQARWSDARAAERELVAADMRLALAEADHAVTVRAATTAGEAVIDQLTVQAAAGVNGINAYLAAVDDALTGEGLAAIGLLPTSETVRRLVRDVLDPPDDPDPSAGVPAEPTPDGPNPLVDSAR